MTFFASHHAIRAEKVLKQHGLVVILVPGPREISPSCGVALQFEHRLCQQVESILATNKVRPEAIHYYRIEADELQSAPSPIVNGCSGRRKMVNNDH